MRAILPVDRLWPTDCGRQIVADKLWPTNCDCHRRQIDTQNRGTDFEYKTAQQFGHNIQATRAGLVPFTYDPTSLTHITPLAGNGINRLI